MPLARRAFKGSTHLGFPIVEALRLAALIYTLAKASAAELQNDLGLLILRNRAHHLLKQNPDRVRCY